MLINNSGLVPLPILSLQTGVRIAATTALIIDPRRLQIVAFYCEGSGIGFQPAVLHTSDIREFSNIGLIVDDADTIMSPQDLVRLQEIIDFHFELIGKLVVQKNGHKVGKISSFTVETESFYILKLQVRPTFWQSLSTTEVIIDRTQIVAVEDKRVVVSDPTIRRGIREPIIPEPMTNPFRKPQAQAATIHEAPSRHSSSE